MVVVSRSLRVDARAGGALWDASSKERQRLRQSCPAQTTALLQTYCNETGYLVQGTEAARTLNYLIELAPRVGIEPTTNGLTVRRSTAELPGKLGGTQSKGAKSKRSS